MRGMVSLWIADLHEDISSIYPETEDEEAVSQEHSMQTYAARQEQDRMMSQAKMERDRARLQFRKVVEGGGQVAQNIKETL